MIKTANKILQVVQKHKAGLPLGITSVCSANKYVLKAAAINAKINNRLLLIESTSNQVDQFGGYTGMTPQNFRDFVFNTIDTEHISNENLILGGDHLGPNVWQNENPEEAMEKAKVQIKSYIDAGYTKIHLDASMKCKDDGDPEKPLDPEIVSERAAVLCEAAENAFSQREFETEEPVYVIGTDVPPPGGSKNSSENIHVTTSEQLEQTINITKETFHKHNLDDAWTRVIAVVVQPGVEFGDSEVFDYDESKSLELRKKIENSSRLVFEAHSTDYQQKESLKNMVKDHFVILKVGPWLTYGYREALFALEMIEKELLSNKKEITLSNLSETIKNEMIKNPAHWRKYYKNDNEEELILKLKYSFSDRIRYYWKNENVIIALNKLVENISNVQIPLTLVSQFMPWAYDDLRSGKIKNNPDDFIVRRILNVLESYNFATAG